MHLRWNLVVIVCLCGFLALGVSLGSLAPRSVLAMQEGSPTPPPDAASAFCPNPMGNNDETGFSPPTQTAGVLEVPGLKNPNPDEEDSAKLRLTMITLQPDTCMLRSYFYPGVIVTVLSGEITLLVEPSSSTDAAPVGSLLLADTESPEDQDLSAPFLLAAGDWLTIANGSIVGFSNEETTEAVFVVAGLKPNGDPASGGCGGGCRGRP